MRNTEDQLLGKIALPQGLINAIVSPGVRDEAGPINAFNPSTPWLSKKQGRHHGQTVKLVQGVRPRGRGGVTHFIGGTNCSISRYKDFGVKTC